MYCLYDFRKDSFCIQILTVKKQNIPFINKILIFF